MVVYKTTNKLNGRYYIGQDSKNDPTYLGSGLLIIQAIEKYGKDNFQKDIIDYCASKEELNEKEKYWIQKLKAQQRNVGYNIADGGSGGDVFSYHPNKEEYRKKLRASSKKNNSTPVVIEKLRNASKKNWQNVDYAEKVRSAVRKTASTEEYRNKLSNAMTKVKHTEEWNKKVGHNNSVRYHFKKIDFFLSKGIDKVALANYFNVPAEKLSTDKKFNKEPDVSILIECKKMHDSGLTISSIIKKLSNAPTYNQIHIFIDMCDSLGACELVYN